MPGPRPDGDARRAARIGAAIAVVAFVLLATGGRPWELFARGPFTSDFYDAQAYALSRGHLDVDPQVASIEGFVVDGKTYFYYGIVPALARAPVRRGHRRLRRPPRGAEHGDRAGRRLPRRRPACCSAAVGRSASPSRPGGGRGSRAASPPPSACRRRCCGCRRAPSCTTRPSCGARPSRSSASNGSSPGGPRGAAATSCGRPSSLPWPCRPAGRRGSARRSPSAALAVVVAWRRAWRDAGLVVIAAAVPVALYTLVNALRFGTPFSVPFDRQVLNDFSATRRAAMADNHDTLFGVKFLPTGARAVPPTRHRDAAGAGAMDVVERSGRRPRRGHVRHRRPLGVAAGDGAGVRRRRRRRGRRDDPPSLAGELGHGLLAAAAAVVPTLTIAFIAQRYLADFVPVLVVGAAVGVPVVAAWVADSVVRRRAVVDGHGRAGGDRR